MLSKEDLLFVRSFLNTVCPKPETTSIFFKDIVEPKVDLRIVVPCYNEEEYLEECLQSIVNQKTQYKWEVICINDGSTDRTADILEMYSKYENVRVIHQENKGFSGARNRGMEILDCRYYMFVDADDILCENAVEEMLQIAEEYNADMVEGDLKSFVHEEELEDIGQKEKGAIKEIESNQISGYTCGKVIKSKLFQNIIFPEKYWFEDSIMAYLIAPQCDRIIKYEKCIYLYRRNMKGITATAGKNVKCIDTYWITELMLEDREKLNMPMDLKMYEKFLDQIALNYVRIEQMNEEIKTSIFFLTADLYGRYAKGFTATSKFYGILERALQLGNYSLYQDGCKILWKRNILKIE